jgi:Mg-chelatase subunit ChlD
MRPSAPSSSSNATRSSPARGRKTTTPPSGEPEIQLPDCAAFPEDVGLDDLFEGIDRAKLTRALAEDGIDAGRRLLEESAKSDPTSAARFAALRERLRRQALRRVERLSGEYDRRADELQTVGRTEQARLDAELKALDDRLRKARSLDLSRIADSGLLDDVSSALLMPDSSWLRPPPRPTLWERIRAAFGRLIAFLRRLFGRAPKVTPSPASKGRTLTFAIPMDGGRALGASELGDALARMSQDQREELRGNLTKNLETKERDVRKEAEEKRREAERQRRALEEERAEARRRAERDVDARVREAEQKRVDRELNIDLPSSLLAARMQGSRHIDESTSYVYREITSDRVHVVLAFDKSGSMAENNKLDAAKKALLALYVAIRRRHPDATIDVVAFENEVRVLDLLELWECTPGAFTNTAEALRTAHLLLQSSRASRREFFLITDGLPEAYTDDDGRVRAGQLDRAMEHALARADELATVKPLKASILLLRSEHPEYEVAARKLAERLQGELVITDPQHLGVELLIRWVGGTETIRRAPARAAMPVPRPPPGTPKARKRKADRRMGG